MASGYNLLEVTPTLNTDEYAVGNCLFVSTEIEGFFRGKNDAAEIKSITIIDRSSDEPDMSIYLTTNSTTLGVTGASTNIVANGYWAVSELVDLHGVEIHTEIS